MLIEVTQKDIKNGVRHDPGNCPIALALKRKFPKARFVRVSNCCVWIDGTCYRVNKTILRFTDSYDFGITVKPHRFRIQALGKKCKDILHKYIENETLK